MNKFFTTIAYICALTQVFSAPAEELGPLEKVAKPLVGDLNLNQAPQQENIAPIPPSTQPGADPRFIPFPGPRPPPPSGTNIDIVNTVIVDGCSRGGKCKKGKKYKKYDDYGHNDYGYDDYGHDDYGNDDYGKDDYDNYRKYEDDYN